MSSGTTDFAATSWLPVLFGIGGPPANYYIGLTTNPPLASFDGTSVMQFEPQGGGYARQVTALGPAWWTAANGAISNATTITFPTPTADWGLITNIILCSTAGAGDLYAWGELRNPQSVLQGIACSLAPGDLIITMPSG